MKTSFPKRVLFGFALLVAVGASLASITTIDLATMVRNKLGLANGGTNVDLSGTGGAHQVLRQSTLGANVSVSQLAEADVTNLTTDLAATEKTVNKDAANGYAGLDSAALLKPAEFTLPRNPQTGTTYAFQDSDRGKIVTFNNATAATIIAATIAQAGAAGAFADGWYCTVQNIGSNAIGLTPTTSTVAGAASLFIPPGAAFTLYSDGSNYLVETPSLANLSSQGGFVSWGLTNPVTESASNVQISAGLAAAKFRVVGFWLAYAVKITAVTFRVGTTADASYNAIVGIYDQNQNKIFQAIFSLASATTTVTTNLSSTVVLMPGWYYFAVGSLSGSATSNIIVYTQDGNTPVALQRVGAAVTSMTNTALPSTLGGITFGTGSQAALAWFTP